MTHPVVKQVIEDVKDSFGEVAAEINEECDRVISSLTEFEGFLGQDIILSGRMLNSKIVDATDTKIKVAWDAKDPESGFPYPIAIVNGFFAFGGNKYIEGRDFPVRAVQNSAPVISLADKLRDKGYKVKIISNNIPFMG